MRTILRIVSVLMLILGIILLVMCAMNIGVVFEAGAPEMVTNTLVGLMVLLMGVSAVLEILGGILGLRAAKLPGGSTGAVVFGVLALASGIFSLVLEFSAANACACILPLLYVICAIGIRSSRN